MTDTKYKGCHRCFNGYVLFTLYDKHQHHQADCAYCNEAAESNYQTYVIQKNDRIYPAYRAVGFKHIADPAKIEAPIEDAVPRYTNARLHEIAISPMLGTMSKEIKTQLFKDHPLKSNTKNLELIPSIGNVESMVRGMFQSVTDPNKDYVYL